MVGLAQVLDGQVVAIDRFATPELFASLEHELLGSYIASEHSPPHEGRTLLPDDVSTLAKDAHGVTTAASFVALARAQPGQPQQ